MKYYSAVLLFTLLFACSQKENRNTAQLPEKAPIETSAPAAEETSAVPDSFTFANRTFFIPRDCNGPDQFNCCSYATEPHQLGCKNGTSLIWYYYPSAETAAGEVENIVSQMQQAMARLEKKPITCYLLDQEIKGYSVSYETPEGQKGNRIIVAGVVEGKAMLVQLGSKEKLKSNDQLQPVIRQIVRFK